MLLPDRKLGFIHIPKCAGTSIEIFFAGRDWVDIDARTKHITAQKAREIYGPEVWDEYFTFSVVRNPWARFLSFFNLVRTAEPDIIFDDWIRSVCSHDGLNFRGLPIHRSMWEYLSGPDGELMVDFVAKVESLEKDFRIIVDRVGGSGGELPRAMVGRYDHDYRRSYAPETRDLVAARFREDIERFDYDY
jgi:sulfotransferase famil protein